MTEKQFKLEMWRHLSAIFRAIALYWFGRSIIIREVSQGTPSTD